MQIRIPLPTYAINQRLKGAGYEVWIVGGAVRDILLQKPSPDWDFTTSATPEQILPLFEESFYDNAYGTVMVAGKHLKKQFTLPDNSVDDEAIFDITTYRTEHGYSDRRRPDKVVWGGSVEEDLKRRDFTINALALRVVKAGKESDGDVEVEVEILDLFAGQEDLKNKLIRAVGDPNERFQEDALRMMRAIRIGAQLGFSIEPATSAAIKNNADLLREISNERVGAEFMKILASNYPADGVMLMVNSGIMEHVIPELLEARGVPQAGHHIYDVFTHMVESLRATPTPDPVVRLATLLHDIAKPRTLRNMGPGREITFYGHEVTGARMAKEIAARLRLSKKDQDRVFTLVRWHMFSYDRKMTDSAIRRFIRRVGVENIPDMMMLRTGDRVGGGSKATSWRLNELQKRIGEQLYEPLSLKDLKIDGNDVMQILKIKPGPKIGTILNTLFEEILEDPGKNTREYLEKRVRELA